MRRLNGGRNSAGQYLKRIVKGLNGLMRTMGICRDWRTNGGMMENKMWKYIKIFTEIIEIFAAPFIVLIGIGHLFYRYYDIASSLFLCAIAIRVCHPVLFIKYLMAEPRR
jgi:hypothetical protein